MDATLCVCVCVCVCMCVCVCALRTQTHSKGKGSQSDNRHQSVCVVVLGDIGRSPRMQYHALSLADAALLRVDIVAYGGVCVCVCVCVCVFRFRCGAFLCVSMLLFGQY